MILRSEKYKCMNCRIPYTLQNIPYIVCNKSHSICVECLDKVRNNNSDRGSGYDLRRTCPVCKQINPNPSRPSENALLLQQQIVPNKQLIKEITPRQKKRQDFQNEWNNYQPNLQRQSKVEIQKKNQQKQKLIKKIIKEKIANQELNIKQIKQPSSQSPEMKDLLKTIDQYKLKVKWLQEQNARKDKMIETLIENNKKGSSGNSIQKIKQTKIQQQTLATEKQTQKKKIKQNKKTKHSQNDKTVKRKTFFSFLSNLIFQILYFVTSIIRVISNLISGILFAFVEGIFISLCVQILRQGLTFIGKNESFKINQEYIVFADILLIFFSSITFFKRAFNILKQSIRCSSSSYIGKLSYYIQFVIYIILLTVLSIALSWPMLKLLQYIQPGMTTQKHFKGTAIFGMILLLIYVVPKIMKFSHKKTQIVQKNSKKQN